MYLSMLNEKQKEYFLELAYQLALIDNDFSEKERIMIESYCNEMRISVPEVIHARPVDEIIQSMKRECTVLEKKIMVFEIIGLALVDGNYDESEKKVIEEIMRVFELDEPYAKECEEILIEYIEIQKKMNILIMN